MHESVAEIKKAGKQETKVMCKDESKDDVSVKTDSGIALDEAPLEAAKKKSKSKKQREKKAAALAAAANQQNPEEPHPPKESQSKGKIVIDLTSSSIPPSIKPETKPKDKKKKSKSSAEAKTKEDIDKVQFDK